MTQLKISPKSILDLEEIFNYSLAQFGSEVAVQYLQGFYASFDRLTESPRIGQSFEDVVGLKMFGHRSHRIFYTFDNDTVLIVRILHKARDATAILN